MKKLYFVFMVLLTFSVAKADRNILLKSSGLNLVKSNKKLLFSGIVSEKDSKKYKNILASGIPNHLVGEFPNKIHPHKITSQTYDFFVRLNPKKIKKPIKLKSNQIFGIALNGIPFDPYIDEWYMNKKSLGWQYEALSGAIKMGFDSNHAHVDEKGAYHYHGLPKLLLKKLGIVKGKISPIIGYAADGFPIRALYGLKGKPVRSSYSLRKGKRSIGSSYDGTFIQDYKFKKGAGDLDECNGMVVNNQYNYFITSSFPVIPRCFVGVPHKSFLKAKPKRSKLSL